MIILTDDAVAKLREALAEAVQSLEYIVRAHPTATGAWKRADDIKAGHAALAILDAAPTVEQAGYRFPKAGIENGYHYSDNLNGEEDRFKDKWTPLYARTEVK